MIKLGKAGEGTYGKVYTAKTSHSVLLNDEEKDRRVAVKRNIIDISTSFTGSIKELDILNQLRSHPHIVNLEAIHVGDPFPYGAMSPIRKSNVYRDDDIHFIFEHALYDGHSFIYENVGSISLLQKKKTMVQILLAIEYMHSKGIIHRDMKPANLLIFTDKKGENTPRYSPSTSPMQVSPKEDLTNYQVKICDFGLSLPYCSQDSQTVKTCTSWYRAPEIVLENPNYGFKSDLWSVGCIFFELFANMPFIYKIQDRTQLLLDAIFSTIPVSPDKQTLDRLFKNSRYQITKKTRTRKSFVARLKYTTQNIEEFNSVGGGTFDQFIDLLGKLLNVDDQARYNATQALEHKFFSTDREYIDKVRTLNPPVANPLPEILIYHCYERVWACRLIVSYITTAQNNAHWYKTRMMFQALDIYDRYIEYKYNNTPEAERNTIADNIGELHTKDESELNFYVCLYLAIKYFTIMTAPVSFGDIVPEKYKDDESQLKAEEFEKLLLSAVLQHSIYRTTVYEYSDYANVKLSEKEQINLLISYCHINQSTRVSIEQLYNYLRSYKIE